MTKDVRDKLLRVSELEEQRDALKTKINTAEDVDAPDAAAIERLGTELRTAEGNLKTARTEYRAAVEAEPETGAPVVDDAEYRERLTLRSKATLGGYLLARMQGRAAGGELAEYQSACGVRGDGIPIDIFESDRPAPVEHRADAAKSKGDAQESTAAVLTPQTATPRRISGRLTLNVEDIAAIGQANFESALRDNLSMVLSDQYDRQCVRGDGVAPNVNGLVNQLTDPSDTTDLATFDLFLAAFAAAIDGRWAATLADVSVITNADAYKLSVTKFRDTATDLGSSSFADFAAKFTGGWSCNSRMPATAATLARAIVYRMGMPGIRTASHPVWSSITIDDIYSDSASGQRHVTMHLLVGSKVLVVQPDAYDLAEFKVA